MRRPLCARSAVDLAAGYANSILLFNPLAILLREFVPARFHGTGAPVASPRQTIMIPPGATARTVDRVGNRVAVLADIAPVGMALGFDVSPAACPAVKVSVIRSDCPATASAEPNRADCRSCRERWPIPLAGIARTNLNDRAMVIATGPAAH